MRKYIIAILLIVFIGCGEDFLTETPKASVTEDAFFGATASEAAVEQFINNMYYTDVWAVWDVRWPGFAEVTADGFRHTTSFNGEYMDMDNHVLHADHFNIFRMWNYIWWPIGRANIFMGKWDYLEENFSHWPKLNWFKGQVLFLRAYNYFQGINAFGPIPLALDPPDGSDIANSTFPELYEQIIADLKEIVDNNLCPEYPQVSESDLGRITMAAAKSVMAKVYLTRSYSGAAVAGDVDNAVLYARDVIENSGHALITEPLLDDEGDTLFTAYERVFLPPGNSVEGIWEFQFTAGGQSNKMNEEWVPRGYYGAWGKARFRASELLYNSFEPGDERKKSYIKGEVVSPATGAIIDTEGNIYMTKYQDNENNWGNRPGSQTNNFIYLRFADMLLIYAEALNKQNNGPTPAAFDAINRVRNRAGLPDLAGTYDYNSFLKAIQDERFKELAGECHRVWDLRRWGYDTYKERVELANPNASVQPHHMLYPIPTYELQQNARIQQNPNY